MRAVPYAVSIPDGSIRLQQVQNFLEHDAPLGNVRSQQRRREGGVVETAQVNPLQKAKCYLGGGGGVGLSCAESERVHIPNAVQVGYKNTPHVSPWTHVRPSLVLRRYG